MGVILTTYPKWGPILQVGPLRIPKDPPNWGGVNEPVWRRGVFLVLKIATGLRG